MSCLHMPSKYLYMCGYMHIIQYVYIFHGMTHLQLFKLFVVKGEGGGGNVEYKIYYITYKFVQ